MIFKKENDCTFLESEGEQKHRYPKGFEFVRIGLLNVVRTSTIKVEIDDGILGLDPEKERWEEKHSLGISATGILEDRITIINRDGTTGETYETIRVELREEPRWDERIEPAPSDPKPRYYKRRDGMIAHDAKGEYGPDAEVGISLFLPVPSGMFRKAWDQLERDPRVGIIVLACRLDVFMASAESVFREPFDSKHLFIEADSSEKGYFDALTINSLPNIPAAKPKEEITNEKPKSEVGEPFDLSSAMRSQAHFNERLLERLTGIAWIGFVVAIAAIVLSFWF